MAEREYSATLRRRFRAPAPVVWALIADTNRWDRAAGLAAGKYDWRELVPGDPNSRARVASARENGFDIEWIEPPYEWLEGRFVRGRRTFTKGPVARGGFSVDLAVVEDGTEVTAHAYVFAGGWFAPFAGTIMRTRFRGALRRYLDALDDVLNGGPAVDSYGWNQEPPAMTVKRALAALTINDVTSGPSTPVNHGEFEYRAKRFAQTSASADVQKQLLALVHDRPDEELANIRPFELARTWGLDRREVLRGFLHAAKVGLVDLVWQLNCPTCRVGAETARTLGEVTGKAHCEACNIGYDLDFAEHIEAIFRVQPAVRAVDTPLYCASSPWFRPHVFAQFSTAAKSEREESGPLPPSPLLVRTMRGARRATLEFGDAAPAVLRIVVGPTSLRLESEGRVEATELTRVCVVNETDDEALISIERLGWDAEIVLGSTIATMPDFLDLFASEAPASGVELTVKALTLLFTDLTGSTALYERLGDARAFALVEEHFRAMSQVIDQYQGAIVKTMGDAVMATFPSAALALQASIEMVREADRLHGHESLSVKIGMHEGPCLAVRANDKLDFFGTTVNVAARLQAQAHGNQIVIMEDLMQHPDVARLVRASGFATKPFGAHLKGIRDEQKLLAIDAKQADEQRKTA